VIDERPKRKTKINCSVTKFVIEMLNQNQPFVHGEIEAIRCDCNLDEYFQGDCKLQIGDVRVLNLKTLRNPAFQDNPKLQKMKNCVERVYINESSSVSKALASCHLRFSSPVGGIKTISHFEVNVVPLFVRVTLDLIDEFIMFFKESEKERLEKRHNATKNMSNVHVVENPGKNSLDSPRLSEKETAMGTVISSESNTDSKWVEMQRRAQTTICIKHMRINRINLCASFIQGLSKTTAIRIPVVEDLHILVKHRTYSSKITTVEKMVERIVNDYKQDLVNLEKLKDVILSLVLPKFGIQMNSPTNLHHRAASEDSESSNPFIEVRKIVQTFSPGANKGRKQSTASK